MVKGGGKTSKLLTSCKPRGRKSLLCWAVCAVLLSPATALSAAPEMTLSMTAVPSIDAVRLVPDGHFQHVRQCQERVGPFVTQSTAWQRLRQAESQGYGVSGVFPCYDGGTRGYCFNVFYQC